MNLLRHGVDTVTIALWSGCAMRTFAPPTAFLHVDVGLKEKPLARTAPPRTSLGPYCPPTPCPPLSEAL